MLVCLLTVFFCWLLALGLLAGAKRSRAHSRMILCGGSLVVAGSVAVSASVRQKLVGTSCLTFVEFGLLSLTLFFQSAALCRRLRSLCFCNFSGQPTDTDTVRELLVTFVFVSMLCARFSHAFGRR